MKSNKQLGIWMDHSVAYIIGLNVDSMKYSTITAQVGEQDEPLSSRDESLINNKKQHELLFFFKRLSDVIINYDEVLLFGPTNAKTEFLNQLKGDLHFNNVKIYVKPADKMSKNQQQAFVKKYFNTYTK